MTHKGIICPGTKPCEPNRFYGSHNETEPNRGLHALRFLCPVEMHLLFGGVSFVLFL